MKIRPTKLKKKGFQKTRKNDEPSSNSNNPIHSGKLTNGQTQQSVYLPSLDLEKDEVLDFDPSVYKMHQNIGVGWPCLSFDFLKDSLGMERTEFPHTIYMVTGTQADRAELNKLWVMKWSNLCQMKHDEDLEEDSESSDEEDADEPVFNYNEYNLNSAVNRLKVMPSLSNQQIVALWLDSGQVSIYDITQAAQGLDIQYREFTKVEEQFQHLYTYKGHSMEGFALDWSPLSHGRLITGDCHKFIYLWNYCEASNWIVDKMPFEGHSQSVEDLQWSPKEMDLFASCSSDKTIKLWDTRQKTQYVSSIIAHESDVNVLSWNK
jgi:ribosome assembly protein RRB1